jgi:hypothetical protein
MASGHSRKVPEPKCQADDVLDNRSLAERRSRRDIQLPNRYAEYIPVDETTGAKDIVRAFVAEAKWSEYDEPEPKSIREAMSLKYWPEWLKAIHQELVSLEAMGVYEEVDDLPPGKKAIGSKWVLVMKCDENGDILRFKARLVTQGFTQIPGQDFTHMFPPVAR